MTDGANTSTGTPEGRGPIGLLGKAMAFESGIWRSLWRWMFRRTGRLPADATAIPYAAGAAPLIWVFIAITAIEIPILHLLLPTLTLRLIALGLGAWACCGWSDCWQACTSTHMSSTGPVFVFDPGCPSRFMFRST